MAGTNQIFFSSPFLLLDVILAQKGNRCAVGSLDVDLGRKSAFVYDFQVLGVLLPKNDITEVDMWRFDLDEGFLAGADQGNIDATGLTQNREDCIDVFVELGGERDGDCGGETRRHAT